MTAYRYWRMYVTDDNDGGYMDCYELQFLISGVNQTGSGTGDAKTEYSGAGAVYAFDGDTGTRYSSAFSNDWPNWLRYDFGAGNDKDIDAIKYMPGFSTTRAPKDFKIQGSDDGSVWVDVFSVTGQTTGWSVGVYREYSLLPVAADTEVSSSLVLSLLKEDSDTKISSSAILTLTKENTELDISNAALLTLRRAFPRVTLTKIDTGYHS